MAFLPALYAAGYFVYELYAVAGGVAFLIGRTLYFRAYPPDPARRGPGQKAESRIVNVSDEPSTPLALAPPSVGPSTVKPRRV